MSKRIKTNDKDVRISTTTIDVVTINRFSFEHDEEQPCIGIYKFGQDEGKCPYEVVDISEIIDLEDLKVFALNWYFNNVEIVKVTKKN